METNNTPFYTNTFQNIWKKHFIANKTVNTFKFIKGVNFYKNSLGVFFNVGKNLTKGNGYRLTKSGDFKNKILIIYDILPNLCPTEFIPENIGVLKSIQYPGFLINLKEFKDIDDYLLKTFSKNTRMKMRKFTKRLEACFNISTKMFFGEIDKNEYDQLFEDFMGLLKKRYSDKQITNNNMQPNEWNFYKEVAYPLILEKKASLFVIYDSNTPIAITFNYHTENTVIDAITAFDVDYAKFNIGYVNILKIIDWCFSNNLKALDFSKGYFDYKKRMCTLEYNFEYHIIYDKTSIKSRFLANCCHGFFEFKAYLRRKNLNVKFHKLTYLLKNKKQSNTEIEAKIIELDSLPDSENLKKINIKHDENFDFLKKYMYDFLYLTVKSYEKIDIFKLDTIENTYIMSSDTLIHQLNFRK